MSSKSAPEPGAARPWSLAARLTAWYAAAAFLTLAGASGFLYWALVTNLDREDDQLLMDKVHLLRTLLRERPGDEREWREEVERESGPRPNGRLYLRVLGADGRVVLESPGMADLLPPEGFPGPTESGRGAALEAPGGRGYRALAAPAPGHVVQVALDRTFEEALLADYRRALWLTLAVSLVLCAVVGYQIAYRGLKPLRAIAATAARVRSTTLGERVRVGGLPAELRVLAATLNEMLDRLEDSFQRLARFSADIAHELRNPVNNLRGEAEVALGQPRSAAEYREVLTSGLEEYARLARLIDSLLFLARAENPRTQIQKERLDLARELATLREFHEAAAAEAGIALTVQAKPGLEVRADRTLFQRAVGNLVANALAHTPAGGAVTLRAALTADGVAVEITDTGEGIPPEHLPHVFDRFYRADAARPTDTGRVGLGLALVKSILALHGGTASLTSERGRGTRVRLHFPRS